MEIFIQFLDELDDIFSPLFEMIQSLNAWRLASVASAAAVAIALNSPVVLAAGLLLAAGRDASPSQAGPLTAE